MPIENVGAFSLLSDPAGPNLERPRAPSGAALGSADVDPGHPCRDRVPLHGAHGPSVHA